MSWKLFGQLVLLTPWVAIWTMLVVSYAQDKS